MILQSKNIVLIIDVEKANNNIVNVYWNRFNDYNMRNLKIATCNIKESDVKSFLSSLKLTDECLLASSNNTRIPINIINTSSSIIVNFGINDAISAIFKNNTCKIYPYNINNDIVLLNLKWVNTKTLEIPEIFIEKIITTDILQ